jgi:hypothetical protein
VSRWSHPIPGVIHALRYIFIAKQHLWFFSHFFSHFFSARLKVGGISYEQ